jgi:hypothetical protein
MPPNTSEESQRKAARVAVFGCLLLLLTAGLAESYIPPIYTKELSG